MERIPIIKGRKGISLTAEHKRKISEALRKKYGTTDYKEAFEKFIMEGKITLESVAEKYKKYASKEDLIQETVLILYKKFDQYNPKLSNANTFINMVARQTMFWYCKPDSLNHSQYTFLMKIKTIMSDYYQKTGKNISIGQLSEELNVPEKKVENIINNGKSMLSLDKKSFEDSEMILGDFISTEDVGNDIDDFSNPEDMIIRSQLKLLLDNGLNSLNEREKETILMSTGYEDGIPKTNREISKKLGVTSAYVGTILKNAIKNMKQYLNQFEDETLEKSKITKNDIIKIALKYLDKLEKALEKREMKNEIKNIIKSIDDKLNNKKIQKSKSIEDIRIRQRDPKIFDKKSLRTIHLSKSLGIKAVIGSLPNDTKLRVQTLIFNKNPEIGKSWSLKLAKSWTKENKDKIRTTIDLKELLQKCQNKINLIK